MRKFRKAPPRNVSAFNDRALFDQVQSQCQRGRVTRWLPLHNASSINYRTLSLVRRVCRYAQVAVGAAVDWPLFTLRPYVRFDARARQPAPRMMEDHTWRRFPHAPYAANHYNAHTPPVYILLRRDTHTLKSSREVYRNKCAEDSLCFRLLNTPSSCRQCKKMRMN